MHHIIYSSRAKADMSFTTLVVLLMQARSLNERHHITGALVYGDGQFMQVMEGEEAVIRKLYERVARDPRHDNVAKLVDEPIAARRFAQWSMAFGEVPADLFAQLSRIAEYQTPTQFVQEARTHAMAGSELLDKMQEIMQAHTQH